MIFFYISKCLILSLFVKYNIYNDKLIKVFLKNIYKCGVIPVKMVQWVLPYMKIINIDNKIIHILENTYENCPIHDINYTRQVFKQDYYYNMDEDYDIINIIGSGSIAQVYKIKNKKSEKLYAMKVKHPNANKDFKTIKYYLNMKFNELYENNNLYKIPKLYKFSNNIIIMDYIPGKSLDTLKDNNIEHYKYHLYIYIFIQNNLFMNDFNHGDLHNYNWKITDDNKIVIYDFGLCWTLNSNKIIDTINILNDGFYNKNNHLIYKAFYNYIRFSSDIDEKYIKEYFHNIPEQIGRFIDFSNHVFNFCLKYNVKLNIKILYMIISYQNILITFMENFISDEENDYHEVYKEEYNICDYHNILPEYKLFLINMIKKYHKKSLIKYDKFNKFIT